ncbi:reticulon-1-A isoform X2 [Patella vulgata]|uniref:reticulon-1-A isoform X2 n=1 Tax=Patella vulgata TaxID=6465 RepID=UPI00217F7D33|nr:reticulon-1-A isoform X2 [Patella vulgata]
MADPRTDDFLSSQPESNNFSDFEQLDKPDAGPEAENLGFDQDEEITSTSFGNENLAEEDLYATGASEATPVDNSPDPLISFGDEPTYTRQSQPSPPNVEPLMNFNPPSFGVDSSSPAPATTRDPTPPSTPEPSDFTKTGPKSVSVTQEETKKEGSWMKNVDPRDVLGDISTADFSFFLDLIYWRDVRKTGVVFGSMMFLLLSLAFFSVLSVVAYLSLAVLTVTLSFRVYKNIMGAVQKSGEGHPFKQYLEADLELPEDKVKPAVENVLRHVNCTAKEVRRLFLIEDLVDSIKFGILLWLLTYIGSWFNGMTLIILAVVAVFTLPKIYETYKVQIDNYVGLATTQINKVLSQVQAKVPFLKKKAKTQ